MYYIKYLLVLTISLLLLSACKLDETTSSNKKQTSDLKLIINEFLASNDAANTDENGEFDDWFEIYNYDTKAINIGGMYVSDSKSEYTAHQIPTNMPNLTTIPAGGFLVIWCDGQPEQGALHASFKLSSGGDDITLTESDGRTVISELTYGAQTTDVSYGRKPDSSDTWESFTSPTPGASNNGSVSSFPPVISNIKVAPTPVNPGDTVLVSAQVTDKEGDLNLVEIMYGNDKANLTYKMQMQTSDSIYSAKIGPFTDGETIYYALKASDQMMNTTQSDTLFFEVGYVAPTLFINEFLASNDSAVTDGYGEYEDFIEIYNPNSNAIDIGGMYISDDLAELNMYQIPADKPDSTTIPAGGFLVLWADKQPEQGVLHVELKLSGKGEQIALTAPNGTAVIDSLTYSAQTTDISYGRSPDGSDNWKFYNTPTPGKTND